MLESGWSTDYLTEREGAEAGAVMISRLKAGAPLVFIERKSVAFAGTAAGADEGVS